MSPIHFDMFESAFNSCGYKLKVLTNDNKHSVDVGLKYVNNDACYPSLCVVGQLIEALQSGEYDLDKVALVMSQTGGGCRASNYIALLRKALKDMGMPCNVFIDFQYTYPITSKGKDYSITLSQGYNTTMDMYDITEGTIPQNKYEIAITKIVGEMLDVEIGDTVTIDYGTEKLDCTVVAYFESMNNLGKLIRIHEDAPTSKEYVKSALQLEMTFTDNPTEDVLKERQEELKDYFHCDDVLTATEYQINCLSVVPTMEAVQYLLLAITLVVVFFVTILMERSFISDEKGEIAIMKAVGFRDGRVILWHVIRFGIVAVVAVILAGILSIPMTHLCITPIFGMMGATHIDYVIDPLKIFVMFPGIIVVLTVTVTFFTALYTKTIKASDTASIE